MQAFPEHLLLILLYLSRLRYNAVGDGLQGTPKHGDRGAQFVRNVGDKISAHLFQPAALLRGILQPDSQQVHSSRQFPNLIVLPQGVYRGKITVRQADGGVLHPI